MGLGAGLAIGAATVGGGILKGLGNQAASNVLAFQESVLRTKAGLVKELGEFEVRQFRRQAKARRGAIVSRAAKSGVDVTLGSAFEVLLEQSRSDAVTMMSITNARAIQAFDLNADASLKAFSSKMNQIQLPFDMWGGALQMGSSIGRLFSGGSQVQPSGGPGGGGGPLGGNV